MSERIVTLIDMDCFFCQVEVKLKPEYAGKPLAVVQYNPWRGGGIIAVNYEARAFGVSRYDRGDDAKNKCPDIILVSVPTERGKADTDRYRKAGREVVDVLCKFSDAVERASVDEAYIDLTKLVNTRMQTDISLKDLSNTFVITESASDSNDEDERTKSLSTWLKNIPKQNANSDDKRLAIGAKIVEEIREAIFKETNYRCSAGIAHNKVLAKLACGLHKPNRQTIIPQSGVSYLYSSLSIKKVRSLGGKFGDSVVNDLGCNVMRDLIQFPSDQLRNRFGDRAGLWLYNIARGIDHEPVTPRLISKSIGCCKKFPGKNKLASKESVQHWLLQLASELSSRLVRDLEENQRRAQQLVVSVQQQGQANSHSGTLNSYQPDGIAHCALELIRKYNNAKNPEEWKPPLEYLGMSAGKFCSAVVSKKTIQSFFKQQMPSTSRESENVNEDVAEKESPTEALLDLVPTLPQLSNPLLNMFYKKLNEKKSSNSEKINNPPFIELCDDVRKDHWISPQEIFPDLEDVDEDVLALLPTPMKEKISKLCSAKPPTVNELFPNKDKIDEEVIEMLPTQMREEIRIKKNSRLESIDKYKEGNMLAIVKKLQNNEASGSKENPSKPSTSKELFPEIKNNITKASLENQLEASDLDLENSENSSNKHNGENFEIDHSTDKIQTHLKEMDFENPNQFTNQTIFEICSECKKSIPLSEFLEHLDFHTAQNLHRSLNSAHSSTITISPITRSSPFKNSKISNVKRKRGRQSNNTNHVEDTKKTKSIASYFTPRNEK